MRIIGHRGAKGLAPENTIASIEKALETGVDAVEFDVHLTRDGAMPLYHDHEYTTPEGSKVAIKDLFFEEVQHYMPDVATLDEALEAISGKTEAYVEIKEHVDPLPICEKLIAYRSLGHTVNVLSFDFALLKKVHKHFPDLPLVVNEEWSSMRAVWRARRLGTRRIQLNQKWLWSGVLKSLQRRGYLVTPYTINDPVRIQKWKAHLDGVVTDRPDLFISRR